jgi:TatD DNase family protein
MLGEAGLGERAVLHCWTGGTRWTKRFAELGVTFSFAGPVAFETGETIRLGAVHADPERCLVETDTPYLSPPPHRDEQNEPSRVRYVGAALAEVWGKDLAEVAASTSAHAARVFGAPS